MRQTRSFSTPRRVTGDAIRRMAGIGSDGNAGDAIRKMAGIGGDDKFKNFHLNTKEGMEARIAELQGKNNESLALIHSNGPDDATKQKAADSVNANQKIIDSLHIQLKDIEENVAAAKRLSDLRKEGHTFITIGSGKGQTVITDDDIIKANMADSAERRRINPPTLDGPGQWNDRDSFDRSNADLDSLRTYGLSRTTKMQIEAGSDWLKDSSRRDDLTMRGINDTAERKARLAGIGAQPGDELAVAAKQRDIRMQAIADDQATLLLSKDRYDITDKMYALEQRAQDAQIEYNEKVAAQLAKQQEQFRSIAGGLYDSFFGGGKGISSFFKSQAEGIGKTIFENAAKFGQTAIMGDGTSKSRWCLKEWKRKPGTISETYQWVPLARSGHLWCGLSPTLRRFGVPPALVPVLCSPGGVSKCRRAAPMSAKCAQSVARNTLPPGNLPDLNESSSC